MMKTSQSLFVTLFAGALALSGCMEKDVYAGSQVETEKTYNDFNFSTVAASTSLEVSYLNDGVEANVYFELYDENPVILEDYRYVKRDDVTPLYAAYTDENGVFKGTVNLPAYLSKVYIYTPAFFAQTLIEAEMVNGAIVASDDAVGEEVATRTVTATDEAHDSYMVSTASDVPDAYKNDTRWKTWLGSYDKYKNGEVQYKYTGTDLIPTNVKDLYGIHQSVINISTTCPDGYRSYSDLYVNEEAEVAITFLGQNTCWNSSLGYYYYKDGEKPASINAANVIMLFPNTQDGLWTNDKTAASKTAGIDRNTTVQLYYYPNIASGSQEGKTTKFPAGYRIGLVLACNAWSNYIVQNNGNTKRNVRSKYRAATSEGLSVDANGNNWNEPRTAAYKYGESIMISFEDYVTDENFSDVVVTLKSNPVDAITDIPVVDPESKKTTATTLKGMYAFEDLWPDNGDFDMNDVMVRKKQTKVFDSDNKIYSESILLKTFQNYAINANGLAIKIKGGVSKLKGVDITGTKEKEGAVNTRATTEFAQEEDGEDLILLLSDDVNSEMGTEYIVTLNYSDDRTIEIVDEVIPFLYGKVEEGDDDTTDSGTSTRANQITRWEVHISTDAPTSKADLSYFNTGSDKSDLENGVYYVNSSIYPFAFFLSGASETDLSKLLDPANESTPIDELYKDYTKWVESSGASSTSWYK
ncbi:MAG: LruC domain-containing protein [Bacteroides sp.]|nr:LruC domain-containing protein [Bacteroides sp.]